MFWWLRIKWISVKVALLSTRHDVRKALSRSKNCLAAKLRLASKKARSARRKASRRTKDLAFRSLPGVSKVKLPQAPFPHLLKSNRPPTEAEEAVIRRAIDKAKAEQIHLEELRKFRQEGSHRRHSISSATTASALAWESVTRHKIKQATRFVNQQSALLSPLRRLPPEILQEIFKALIPSFTQTHPRWRTPADLPWILGQVCHTWRVNALAVSELWAHLPSINLLRKAPRKTAVQMQYLSELLRRSKGASLELYVHSRAFEGTKHPVIDLLCEHAERWAVASFELAPHTLLGGFKSVKGRIHNLRSLTLQTRIMRDMDLIMDGPSFVPLDLFEDAPSLEVVSVSGPSFTDILLPFGQLIHYKERLIFGNRIGKVVSSELLESLTVLELADDAVFPAVTLPKLKKLQVKFQYRPQHNVFHSLSLPVIEDIRLVSYRGNLMGSLIQMLSNSKSPSSPSSLPASSDTCRLKSLSIRLEFLGPGDLRRALLLTPHLKNLDVTLPLYARDLLDLAEGFRGRVMVPHLETCAFHLEELVNTDEISEALNALGKARCGAQSTSGSDLSESEEDESSTQLPLLANEAGELTLQPSSFLQAKTMTLTLYCDGSDWIHSQQAMLEGWLPSPTSVRLNTLREALESRFPDLSYGRATGPSWMEGVVGVWDERVGKILSGVEGIVEWQMRGEGEKGAVGCAEEVYYSRILHPLKSLADSKLSSLSGISKRCQAILDKWRPMLEANVPERHWAFKGPYALSYVADDDALRNDKENVMDIVYGLKDATSFSTAFWPMFMAR
ncbi:hypothetical protein CVT26_012035 [Gymnopilus dilepis]|uniref:F-box domain-containing protein n=1 Tax=Gymnopilus dilepis TaxID=231916 RepID=A0A409VYB6_9AGAR|nr:hypothetical protein CVT26_012035 [Gymnopilus dilepis]